MQAEYRRVRRLQRLEMIRAQAKQAAVLEAAQAEGTLAQLMSLSVRTEAMAADYHARPAPDTGQDLRQLKQFIAGLSGIANAATQDAEQARALADRKQTDLGQAERRRAAAQERVRLGEKMIAAKRNVAVLGSRRAIGTGLE